MSLVKYTVPNYNTGVAVEIKYIAPTSGERVQFTLRKDDNNYMFLVAVRYDTKQFIVNTKLDGNWGEEVTYNDRFNFNSNIAIVIRVKAMPENYFLIEVNGNHMAKFQYRHNPVTDVVEAGYQSNVKLESFFVQY
ncbi:uncharacterized protein [Dysidea avara]|uniref:uncharacterized protein n=1 Tax=Dysidea avara TaxID=196820 RepID=UPI00331872C6